MHWELQTSAGAPVAQIAADAKGNGWPVPKCCREPSPTSDEPRTDLLRDWNLFSKPEAAVRQVLRGGNSRSSRACCWSRSCFSGSTGSCPSHTQLYFSCLWLPGAHSTPLLMALWLIVTDVIHIRSNGADLKYKAGGFSHISAEMHLSSAAKTGATRF